MVVLYGVLLWMQWGKPLDLFAALALFVLSYTVHAYVALVRSERAFRRTHNAIGRALMGNPPVRVCPGRGCFYAYGHASLCWNPLVGYYQGEGRYVDGVLVEVRR